MFTDKELRDNFSGEQPCGNKKSKWYMFLDYINTKVYPDLNSAILEKILEDRFWTDDEKSVINRIFAGEKIFGWAVETRTFGGGEHLDVCVIYCPSMIH